ncbi:MAG: DUF4442 domain-containing protein [Bacteroidetes bacterium]|nr:DUF4442 domain-containing protein [Bacteroidota bacterium]
MHSDKFIAQVHNRWKFKFFQLWKLPASFFSGVRVDSLISEACVCSVPHRWITQNPFRSTYFASLSMAAEMSTGLLAMAHLYQSDPPVSMLVVRLESDYFKKATERIFFTCADGKLFYEAVKGTLADGLPRTVRARSTGRNPAGEVVADFYITWSIKAKTSK